MRKTTQILLLSSLLGFGFGSLRGTARFESVPAQPPKPVEPKPSKPTGQSQAPETKSQPSAKQPAQSGVPAQEKGQEAAEKPAAPQEKPGPPPSGIAFRAENAPIASIIQTVMDYLGYSYVIDPQVQGTVSIQTVGRIPREGAFEVLERLLQMNGQGIVKQGNLYVIVPLGQATKVPHHLEMKPPEPAKKAVPAAQKPPAAEPPAAPAPAAAAQPGSVVSEVAPPVEKKKSQGVITYVIPLNYIPSAEMVSLIQPFASNGATIINYASANMVMVTDFRENIEQILKIVRLLDTRYFELQTVDLLPIRYNQAPDVAEDLAKIFAPGDPAGVRIVAIERLNSILVVTRSPAALQEVKKWIGKLDVPSAASNIKTWVYQVENNTAKNIADVLAQLYQDGLGLPSGPSPAGQGTGAAAQPAAAQRPSPLLNQPQSAFQGQFQGRQQGEIGPSLSGRPLAGQSSIRAVVTGNVKIIVNEFNNSLIIQASEADYHFLMETIRQLDVLPRQVLIEAKIYSVELKNDLSYGVAAFLRARQGETLPDPNNPGGTVTIPATTGSISAPSGTSPGGALTIMTRTAFGGRELEAIVNALRTRTNVEILEAPRILAMDGMQANINVGADVPVTTASFGDPIQAGTPTSFVNSIQFRPTGTTLLIMPRISASGIVTMDIAIEVSSASGAALTPTINRNFVTTTLLVRDGQTVSIAGIISDTVNVTRSRVPLLGDIPFVGGIFGQTNRNKRRLELIFFITPHVIRGLPTATELTLDFKRALRNAYKMIEEKDGAQRELIQERRLKESRKAKEKKQK